MTQPHTEASEKTSYRSPQRILVRFFEKSRDQWKAKCLDAKAALRRFKNRAKWLEQSRDHWKNRVHGLARQVRELEALVAKQEAELEQNRSAQCSESLSDDEAVKKTRSFPRSSPQRP
jgi:chromosome segregation ATPase